MKNDRLLEVWNDTVDSHHLIGALIIGAAVSLGTFWAAYAILSMIVDEPQMARTYAMLFGIIGCVLGGTICAILFRPKREVLEDTVDSSDLQQVLATLYADYGGSGRLAELPESVRAELRELELEEAFQIFESRNMDSDPERATSVSGQRLYQSADQGAQP